jgi:hypothetical protein
MKGRARSLSSRLCSRTVLGIFILSAEWKKADEGDEDILYMYMYISCSMEEEGG